MNGFSYFLLFIAGIMPVVFYSIDPVCVGVVLIAVGLMIVQMALQKSDSRHYPCLMIGIMFLIADMIFFDHFDATVRVATRSIGRMKGVMNMAPMGGIICSLIIPAILCDLVDGRFFRSSIFCLIAAACSWTGLMHGANYIQPSGMMIPAMGADESDYYTTDLGEFMLSLPRTATHESWQTDQMRDLNKAQGLKIGEISAYDWKYKIDDQGFEDPYRCPPWMQIGVTKPNSNNLPCPEPKKQHHAYNEGWRFALAYLAGAAFIAIHGVVAKYTGKVEPIMDNGAAKEGGVAETVRLKENTPPVKEATVPEAKQGEETI